MTPEPEGAPPPPAPSGLEGSTHRAHAPAPGGPRTPVPVPGPPSPVPRPRSPVPTELSHGFHIFIERGLRGASGPLVAGGQRVDVGIVEKGVVAVAPGEGLRREGESEPSPRRPAPPAPPPGSRELPYLGADAQVVVGHEGGALVVARVQPAVEGAEGHAGQRQHEGQEAPGAACRGPDRAERGSQRRGVPGPGKALRAGAGRVRGGEATAGGPHSPPAPPWPPWAALARPRLQDLSGRARAMAPSSRPAGLSFLSFTRAQLPSPRGANHLLSLHQGGYF